MLAVRNSNNRDALSAGQKVALVALAANSLLGVVKTIRYYFLRKGLAQKLTVHIVTIRANRAFVVLAKLGAVWHSLQLTSWI